MSNNHPKMHHKGEGYKLIGSPEDLILLMVSGDEDRKFVIEELEAEGPKHKQVLSILLMQRLYKLVQAIEIHANTTFSVQEGEGIKVDKKVLPIVMPIHASEMYEKDKIIKTIRDAPAHETLAYAMCLQVVEWGINALAKE